MRKVLTSEGIDERRKPVKMNKNIVTAFLIVFACFAVYEILASDGRPALCRLPPKVGLCDGLFPRFYFDSDTETCKQFVYGGCNGNANKFKTKEECEKTCKV